MQDITPVKINLDSFKKTKPAEKAPVEEAAPENKKLNEEYLTWETEEYEFVEKSTDWYWMIGVISVALIAIAIFMQNILFAAIVMLGGFSFALLGARRPQALKFAIGLHGIKIDSKVYLYDNLDSFWINYDPPHKKELIIVSKRTVMPHISIPLADIDPNEAREHLMKFLPEKPHEESLAEILGRLVGF